MELFDVLRIMAIAFAASAIVGMLVMGWAERSPVRRSKYGLASCIVVLVSLIGFLVTTGFASAIK